MHCVGKERVYNLPISNVFGLLLSHISFPLLPASRGYDRAWFVCDVTSPLTMDLDRVGWGGVGLRLLSRLFM